MMCVGGGWMALKLYNTMMIYELMHWPPPVHVINASSSLPNYCAPPPALFGFPCMALHCWWLFSYPFHLQPCCWYCCRLGPALVRIIYIAPTLCCLCLASNQDAL